MMNGKGILAVAIILMCVGFGGVINEVTSEAPTRTPRPPSTVVAPALPSALPSPVAPPPEFEEYVYMDVLTGFLEIDGDTSQELGLLMGNPQILDDDWRFEVAFQVALRRILYEEVKAIDPPSSLSNYHNKYVESLYHYDKAGDLLLQGIDELDPDLLEEAGVEMEIGLQLMEEAGLLLDEFIESRGY
jgi:hypothetical protein